MHFCHTCKEAEVRLVCAGDTVMEEGLITWLARVAMVLRVVAGVTREALALATLPPARLDDTVPVTVPRVVTPLMRGTEASGVTLNAAKLIGLEIYIF